MATLSVTLPASITATPPKFRMYMATTDNKYKFGALLAPLEVEYSGLNNTWTEVERDGRAPYLVKESSKLATMSFTINLVYSHDPDHSIQGGLSQLIAMSRSDAPINMTYGGSLDTRLWRMTNMTINVKRRHPVSSAPTWAYIDIELTAASDVKLTVGPVSGGKTTTTSPPKGGTKTHYYTVKKGDTITKIAIKVYGKASAWRKLADLNKIKNPKKLKVGTRLKY